MGSWEELEESIGNGRGRINAFKKNMETAGNYRKEKGMCKEEEHEIGAEYHVFTFGSNHVTEEGRSLGNYFVVVHGNFNEARELMVEARGEKWAFQYPNKEAAGVDRFRLQEKTLEQVYIKHCEEK